MSQLTQNGPVFKELPPRPSTMAENHKRAQLTQSSSNIITSLRTQNTIKIEPNGEELLFRGATGRVSLGEVTKPEYLHIRLMKRNGMKTPNNFATKVDDKPQEIASGREIIITKTRKVRGVSVGRVSNQNPLMEKEITNRPGTTQNLGQKGAYFDDLLSSPEVLKNYKIMSHIGKGAFSVVSLAIDRETKKNYAIKAYEKVDALDWTRLACIKREIRNLKGMNNDKIVKLVGLVKERKRLYLIMENGGNQSLGGLMRKQRSMGERQAKQYFKQILQGISYVHQTGICHRDLKPENILIGDNRQVKIIDFGFSASTKLNLTNFCGTPAYMCPQIVRKIPYNGAKADIWALGVILYVMLIGTFPFRAANEQQLYRLIINAKYRYREQGAISESAKRFISRMLQPKPEQRPSAAELLKDSWLN